MKLKKNHFLFVWLLFFNNIFNMEKNNKYKEFYNPLKYNIKNTLITIKLKSPYYSISLKNEKNDIFFIEYTSNFKEKFLNKFHFIQFNYLLENKDLYYQIDNEDNLIKVNGAIPKDILNFLRIKEMEFDK